MLFRALIIAVIAAVGASTGSAHPASVRPSANVVVIPGFQPPRYPGTVGIPAFPRDAPALSNFRFSQLGSSAITTAALQQYDTVILYGLRWATLSPQRRQRSTDSP